MSQLIPVFLLKTDIADERIPFFAALQVHDPVTGKSMLPQVVEQTVENYLTETGIPERFNDTLIVHIRTNFSRKALRAWFSVYFKQKKCFLVFICDCIQRSDMLMNTIQEIYGQKNIGKYSSLQETTK